MAFHITARYIRRQEERGDCTRLSRDYSSATGSQRTFASVVATFIALFTALLNSFFLPRETSEEGVRSLLEMTKFHRCLFLVRPFLSLNGGWNSPSSFGMMSERGCFGRMYCGEWVSSKYISVEIYLSSAVRTQPIRPLGPLYSIDWAAAFCVSNPIRNLQQTADA